MELGCRDELIVSKFCIFLERMHRSREQWALSGRSVDHKTTVRYLMALVFEIEYSEEENGRNNMFLLIEPFSMSFVTQ